MKQTIQQIFNELTSTLYPVKFKRTEKVIITQKVGNTGHQRNSRRNETAIHRCFIEIDTDFSNVSPL